MSWFDTLIKVIGWIGFVIISLIFLVVILTYLFGLAKKLKQPKKEDITIIDKTEDIELKEEMIETEKTGENQETIEGEKNES